MSGLRFIPHNKPDVKLSIDISKVDEAELRRMLFVEPLDAEPWLCRVRFHSTMRRWQFPNDPFVSYEFDDELWARPLEFGREIEVPFKIEFPRAQVRKIGSMIFVTPATPKLSETFSMARA